MIPDRLHPEALAEMIKAALRYDRESSGLGFRFLGAIDNARLALRRDPLLRAPDAKARRKWQVKKFPYAVIYRFQADEVFILAVAHAKRAPGYWKEGNDDSDSRLCRMHRGHAQRDGGREGQGGEGVEGVTESNQFEFHSKETTHCI